MNSEYQSPAVGNDEAMRRAVQVFYLLDSWSGAFLDFKDGDISAEEAVEKFNDIATVVGMAYKIEMELAPEFLVELMNGFSDLKDEIAAAEVADTEEKN